MSRDAGHFENPGALAQLKSNDANVGGGDWHRGAPVMTADAWPSPSRVGEDEVALDEVMRGSSGRAWRCRGAREVCSEPSPAMGALVQESARTGRASRGRALDAKRALLQRHI